VVSSHLPILSLKQSADQGESGAITRASHEVIFWTAVAGRVAADHIPVSASSAYIGWLAHIAWKAYTCCKPSSAG